MATTQTFIYDMSAVTSADDTDIIIIENGTSTNKMTVADFRNALNGSATLTTTSKNVNGAINELDGRVGHDSLTTTAQDLTGGINELKTNVGDMALNTTSQNLTGAIDEVNTKVNNLNTKIAQSSSSLTYETGYTDSDESYYSSITKSMNVVFLQINAKVNSGYFTYENVQIGTIPVGYRPASRIRFSANCGGNTWNTRLPATITVYPNGAVYVVCSNGSSTSDAAHVRGGISYPAVN